VGKLFGTDGIRGVANQPPMTPEAALAVGRAVTQWRREDGVERPQILVGRDTRLSGAMLESALAAGICSAGGDVIKVGVLPTPGVAFALRDAAAAAGVVISASHNPFEDNGIKIFSAVGLKLTDEEEARIEDLMASDTDASGAPRGPAVGAACEHEEASTRYAAFCCNAFPGDNLEGLTVVLDCANGATSWVAPEVFSQLGAHVVVINDEPNGVNINAECGSEHTAGLSRTVRDHRADVGLAFDGDGDRLMAVDENGDRLTGDQVIAICAQMYRELGWLDNGVVVTTVMSNLGLRRALKDMGVEHAASQVGDRHVVRLMAELGAAVGGEESGHIVFRRHHSTGDGIVAGLQLLGAMRYYGRSLSALATLMTVMPQVIVNVEVASKPPLAEVPRLQAVMREIEDRLGEDGRILVRYSGTQAMARVMVEGPNLEEIQGLAGVLVEIIREEIGAA
jgi:phosphoglucosamine mutase